jgi:hypothetical protein
MPRLAPTSKTTSPRFITFMNKSLRGAGDPNERIPREYRRGIAATDASRRYLKCRERLICPRSANQISSLIVQLRSEIWATSSRAPLWLPVLNELALDLISPIARSAKLSSASVLTLISPCPGGTTCPFTPRSSWADPSPRQLQPQEQ